MIAVCCLNPDPRLALAAIYKRSTSALLILGFLAGVIQAVDAGIGVFQQDWGKSIGPLAISVLQFFAAFTLKQSIPCSKS
jgi:hypothetical protein